MDGLVIVSAVPGRRRAGHVFTGAAHFPAGHFTTEQLHELVADQQLTLATGTLLATPADVDAYLAAQAKPVKGKSA